MDYHEFIRQLLPDEREDFEAFEALAYLCNQIVSQPYSNTNKK